MDPLSNWSLLPKWIQDAYDKDPALHKIVKDWRMTDKPVAILYEKLAIKMFELKNFWEATANEKIDIKDVNPETEGEKILAAAKNWIEGDMGWEYIYDQIFSVEIAVRFRELYPSFSYCDPDTSYEDDARAWYRAAKEYIQHLNGRSKGDWIFERCSGYAGFRCSKCATWVYEHKKRVCQCDD